MQYKKAHCPVYDLLTTTIHLLRLNVCRQIPGLWYRAIAAWLEWCRVYTLHHGFYSIRFLKSTRAPIIINLKFGRRFMSGCLWCSGDFNNALKRSKCPFVMTFQRRPHTACIELYLVLYFSWYIYIWLIYKIYIIYI